MAAALVVGVWLRSRYSSPSGFEGTPTTIGFQGLSGDDGAAFTSYTESGFAVEAATGRWLINRRYGNPAPFIYFIQADGVAAVSPASIFVTSAGRPLIFYSAELYSSVTPIIYSFVGTRDGHKVFEQTGTTPNTFGRFGFARLEIEPAYKNILVDRLQLQLSGSPIPAAVGSNPVGIDNIVVVR